MSVMYISRGKYEEMNSMCMYIFIRSPMSEGRGVCVCLYIYGGVWYTHFTRETYLICIIHPWCSIFWYLVIKIRFYVLSFSISTSSFVLAVGIISCDKVLASLPVYIIFKSLCWLILPLYRLFFFCFTCCQNQFG